MHIEQLLVEHMCLLSTLAAVFIEACSVPDHYALQQFHTDLYFMKV